MAYPPAPPPQYPPPESKQRPGAVTAVVWMMYLTAISLIISGIGSFVIQGEVKEGVEQALQEEGQTITGEVQDTIDMTVLFLFVIIATISLIWAAFYFILALTNSRGSQASRVLTWILAGITLLCCGLGTLFEQTADFAVDDTAVDVEDQVADSVAEATPMWLSINEFVLMALTIAGSIAIIVLLALPASNQFFRKQPPPNTIPGHQPPPGGPQGPPQPPYGGYDPNTGGGAPPPPR